jgi:cytochrome c-type biogenesis protein CcmH
MRTAHPAWALLAAGLALVLTAAPVSGQTPVPSDDDVNAIAKGLYCPVCENIPLDVCGTQACEQWRAVIREKLALGWSADRIRQYFAEQYGMRVLDEPPASGLNWLIYVLPPLAVVAGGYVVARTLRSWSRPPVAVHRPAEPEDPYAARLEDEVRRRS